MTMTGTGRFIVGTRGSALARWQTDHVTEAVLQAHAVARVKPEVTVKVITTQGDVSLAERLVGQIEKGFFTAELEEALRSGEIHWAVHSLKDLPTRLPDDLVIAAVLPRHRPNDLLVVREEAFADRGPHRLPTTTGARIGTSSLRRDAQLKTFAPDCASLPLRGNVPTRLEKLRANGDDGRGKTYDAIVLAGAGVLRLGLPLDGLRVVELDARRWQPAPGQGAIAVEALAPHAGGAPDVAALFAPIDHAETRAAVDLERRFLRVLEGGCSTPFGAHVAGADGSARDGSARAWLGRAGDDGVWRAVQVALPSAPSLAASFADVDDAFIHETLDQLARAPKESAHVDDAPLWRPL